MELNRRIKMQIPQNLEIIIISRSFKLYTIEDWNEFGSAINQKTMVLSRATTYQQRINFFKTEARARRAIKAWKEADEIAEMMAEKYFEIEELYHEEDKYQPLVF